MLLSNIPYKDIEQFSLAMSLYNLFDIIRNQLSSKALSLTMDLVIKMTALRHLSLDFSMYYINYRNIGTK